VYSSLLRVCIYSVFYFVVLAIYSKSAGKSGKHSLVSDASNIAAVSNIPVQLFEHFIGIQFRAHHAGATFHVKRFYLLPSLSFLCTLSSTPTVIDNGHSLRISQQDWNLFKMLKDGSSSIIKAIETFNKHTKKSVVRVGDDED